MRASSLQRKRTFIGFEETSETEFKLLLLFAVVVHERYETNNKKKKTKTKTVRTKRKIIMYKRAVMDGKEKKQNKTDLAPSRVG